MFGVRKECLDAFYYRDKEKALKLLPQLRSPETIRDSREGWQGFTLVHHAAYNGWADVCKMLVEEHNCDPTAVDDTHRSPLHDACYGFAGEAALYLLQSSNFLTTLFN